MSLITAPVIYPSVYDKEAYPEEQFQAELARIHAETAIEREWIEQAGLEPFQTDEDILKAARAGRLRRVGQGAGYSTIQMLFYWDSDRSDPAHQWHYSPPYLRVDAHDVMLEIATEWSREMGMDKYLSITSLARCVPYQARIASQPRKATITEPGKLSSHQAANALDIDGYGIYRAVDNVLTPMNPDTPGCDLQLLNDGQEVLVSLLEKLKKEETINFVDELPGTKQHVFHVARNPL